MLTRVSVLCASLVFVTLIWAGERQRVDVPVLDDRDRPVGAYQSIAIAVPDETTRADVSIDRANFSNALSTIEIILEAQVASEWRVIKHPQSKARGGTRVVEGVTQTVSHTHMTLPQGATHVRVSVIVGGRSARAPVKVTFD